MTAHLEKFNFRLVLLGSNRTGKTSILNRFLSKKFDPKYKATVEDLFSKDFDLGSIEISVDFLDTSGSMQFPAMRRLSITTANAFLIVYALDDELSYEVLKRCVAEIREIRPDFQEIPIVFAGNKCDCPREARKVPKEIVSNYVYYELPRMRAKVIECSSKDDVNIEAIFRSYLSLAKVSLAETEGKLHHPSSKNQLDQGDRRDSNTLKGLTNQQDNFESNTMGARKACHSSSMKLARKGQLLLEEVIQVDNQSTRSSNNNDNNDELNLEAAVKMRLQVDSSFSKPRSRSLIWRSSRKSRQNNRESNCYPS